MGVVHMTDRSSSPLRFLDISDDAVAADIMAEKARELSAAYERIEDLQNAIKGLLGLCQLVAGRDDISFDVSNALRTSHRIVDAEELLR
jgi:hypothetical protein